MMQTRHESLSYALSTRQVAFKGLKFTFLVAYTLFGIAGIYAVAVSPEDWGLPGLVLLPLSLVVLHLFALVPLLVILVWYLGYWALTTFIAWAMVRARASLMLSIIVNIVVGVGALLLADALINNGWIFTNPEYTKNWFSVAGFLLSAILISSYAAVAFRKTSPLKLSKKMRQPAPKPGVTAVPEGVSREQRGNGFFGKALWKIVLSMAVTVVLLTLVAGFTSPVLSGFSDWLNEGSPDNLGMLFVGVGYGASQMVLTFLVLGVCGAVVTGVLLALAYGQIKARVPVALSLAVGLVVSSIPGGLVFWYTRGWLQRSIEYTVFYSSGLSFTLVTVGIMTTGGAAVFLTAYCALKKESHWLPDAPLTVLLGMRQEFHQGRGRTPMADTTNQSPEPSR